MSSKRPINILHVTHAFNQGGIENFILNSYNAVDRSKYHFVFLAFDEPGPYELGKEFSQEGVEPYHVLANTIKLASYRPKHFSEISHILDKENIDIVHLHPYSCGEIIPTIAKRKNIPVIVHSHASGVTGGAKGLRKAVKSFIIKPLMYHSNHLASERIACSSEAGKFYFKNKPFTIVKNGVDFSKFRFSEQDRQAIRKQHNIADSDLLLVHTGRFVKDKNHTFLFSILHEIQKTQPSARLMLIGDGSMKPAIEQEAKDRGLKDSIIFLGAKSDIGKYLSSADVFVMPSLSEGFGIALLEAQANGLPCIASDTVPREADQTGDVKFLSLKESSVEDWATAVTSSVRAHKAENYNLLRDSDYSTNNSTKSLEGIYDQVFRQSFRSSHAKEK